MWLSYLVARRMPTEKVHEEFSRILRKLSDKGVKDTVKVSAEEEQAKEALRYGSCHQPQSHQFRLWAVSELVWQKAQLLVYFS